MKLPLFCLPGFTKVPKKKSAYRPSSLPEGICRRFSLSEIKAATNNFNQCSFISDGGFGSIYRGTIDDKTTTVAVKRLHKNSDEEMITRFKNEARFVCQLNHPNLISLIGLCDEQEEMILVYEFTSRGSLDKYLDRENSYSLPWKLRLKICIDSARGLHYLHTGAKYVVLHRDLTTSKILLDEDMSGKLSSFWLSKLGPNSMSKASIVKQESQRFGTHGFMAPEYLMHGEITDKFDVFSFGMVLLDVLCGIWFGAFSESELANMQTIYDLIDPYLKGKIAPECLEKYLEIASSCIQNEGSKRPAMGEVEVTLELALELQNKADLQMEGNNPNGEVMYEDAAMVVSITNILDHLKSVYGSFSDTEVQYW